MTQTCSVVKSGVERARMLAHDIYATHGDQHLPHPQYHAIITKGRKRNLLSFHSESVEAMVETQFFKYQVAVLCTPTWCALHRWMDGLSIRSAATDLHAISPPRTAIFIKGKWICELRVHCKVYATSRTERAVLAGDLVRLVVASSAIEILYEYFGVL